MALAWRICEEITEQEQDAIVEGVLSHGRAQAQDGNAQPLACLVYEAGRLVAGGVGRTEYRRLFVTHLWVYEPLRGQGIGTRILLKLEAEAARRGCAGSMIETLDEGVASLYQRLGYAPVAVVAGYVGPFNRHIMLKSGITDIPEELE